MAIRRNNLGLAWYSLGEYEKAIGYFEQALDIFKARLGEDHPNTRVVQGNLDAAKAEKAKSASESETK